MDNPHPVPSLALAAYSEDFISGRRVVVFGNALSGLAEALLARGARLVHVYDEHTTRVAEATARATNPSISFAPLGPGGIAARDGAFDVGLIDDVQTMSDPAKTVTRLRRALTARGVGFVGTPNPDVRPLEAFTSARSDTGADSTRPALSYYDLYDLVSAEFDEVRMVGQTPFVGYALADFSPEAESEFSIDTGFVQGGAEEPERYVAVCSHFPVTIDPFCVVQMQAIDLLKTATAPVAPERDRSSEPSPRELLAVQTELQQVRAALVSAQAQVKEAQATAAAEREARTKHEQLLFDAQAELRKRDEWVIELESRAATADERADNAQSDLEHLEQQVRSTNSELDALKRELEASRHALQELSSQRQAKTANEESRHNELQALQNQLEELREKLTQKQAETGTLRQDLAWLSAEQATLEGQLRERGRVVSELQSSLATTEHLATTLLVKLENAADENAADENAADENAADENAADERTSEFVANLPGSGTHADPAAAEFWSADHEGPSAVVDEQFDSPPSTSDAAAIPDPWLIRDSQAGRSDASAPVDAKPGAIASAVDGTELQAVLQREAEHLAALEAARWTIDELENKLLSAATQDVEALLQQLYIARQQLQRQAVILQQYERHAAARVVPSPSSPPTAV